MPVVRSPSPAPTWAIHVDENSQGSSANPSEDELEEDELEGYGSATVRKRKATFAAPSRETPKRARYHGPEGDDQAEGSTRAGGMKTAQISSKKAPSSKDPRMMAPPTGTQSTFQLPSNPSTSTPSNPRKSPIPASASASPKSSFQSRLNFWKTGADSAAKTTVRKRKDISAGARKEDGSSSPLARKSHPIDLFFTSQTQPKPGRRVFDAPADMGGGSNSVSANISSSDKGKRSSISGKSSSSHLPAKASTSKPRSVSDPFKRPIAAKSSAVESSSSISSGPAPLKASTSQLLARASTSKPGIPGLSKRPVVAKSRTGESSSSGSIAHAATKMSRLSDRKTVTPDDFGPPSAIKLERKPKKDKHRPRKSAPVASELIVISDDEPPPPSRPRPRPPASIDPDESLELFSSGEERVRNAQTTQSTTTPPSQRPRIKLRALPPKPRHSMPDPEVISISSDSDEEPPRPPFASLRKSASAAAVPALTVLGRTLRTSPVRHDPAAAESARSVSEDPMDAPRISPVRRVLTSQSDRMPSKDTMSAHISPIRHESTPQSARMLSVDPRAHESPVRHESARLPSIDPTDARISPIRRDVMQSAQLPSHDPMALRVSPVRRDSTQSVQLHSVGAIPIRRDSTPYSAHLPLDDPMDRDGDFEPPPPPSPSPPSHSRPQTPARHRRERNDIAMSTSPAPAPARPPAVARRSSPIRVLSDLAKSLGAGKNVEGATESLPATPMTQLGAPFTQNPPSTMPSLPKRKPLTQRDLLPTLGPLLAASSSSQLLTSSRPAEEEPVHSSRKSKELASIRASTLNAGSSSGVRKALKRRSVKPSGSKDMRPLEPALGLEPSPSKPDGAKAIDSLQEVLMKPKRHFLPVLKPSSLSETIVLAGKLNSKSSVPSTAKSPAGASREQAIDLTFDESEGEELESAADVSQGLIQSSRILVDFLNARKIAETDAQSSGSSHPPSGRSRATTDELAIRPSQQSTEDATSSIRLPVRSRPPVSPSSSVSSALGNLPSSLQPSESAQSKSVVSGGGNPPPVVADSFSAASHSHPPSSPEHSPAGSPSLLDVPLPSLSAPPGSPVSGIRRQEERTVFTRCNSIGVLDRKQATVVGVSSPLANAKLWRSVKATEQLTAASIPDPHLHSSAVNQIPATTSITPCEDTTIPPKGAPSPSPPASAGDFDNHDLPVGSNSESESFTGEIYPSSPEQRESVEESAYNDPPIVDKFLESDPEAAMEVEECEAILEYMDEQAHEVEGERNSNIREPPQVPGILEHQFVPEATAGRYTAPPGEEANEELSEKASGRSSPNVTGAPRRSSRRSSASGSSEGLIPYGDYEGVYESPASSPSPTLPLPALSDEGGKTYGGIKAITWADYRQNLDNFIQTCYHSKDLPHSLQDTINNMSEEMRMQIGIREVFRATICENTAEDEPDAPDIEVVNKVDAEPTPPWEFHYSNKMWHGEGVPPPDIRNLDRCDCVGKCDPKSKTCACLKRQRKYYQDPNADFAYDNRGRLKNPGYPIFECNDLCGCDDECRNRVVQHGRKVPVRIAKTATKGWGVFAGPKKIPKGTFLGIYSGELLTDSESEKRGLQYDMFGRTYLFDLDFHHLREGNPKWETKYVVDAYHAGNFTRFVNHSCDPNSRLYPCYINDANIDKPLLVVFAIRDIEADEEITFSYTGYYPDDGESDNEDDSDEGSTSGDGDRPPVMTRNAAIYVPCLCGAAKCSGVMFK